MYSPIEIENVEYQLKPMNCPFHITIYKSQLRSYRELPLPLRGAGHRLPLRALGRAARPDARARLHPGRRAPLLPAGPARGGDRARARLRDLDPERPSASSEYDIYLSTQAGERQRAPTSSGRSATAALKQRARDARPRRTRSTRARASSTGRRSTSRSRTRSTAPGSARPSRSTSTTRTASSLEYIGEDGKAHQPVMVHRALLGQPGALLRRADRALRGRVPALAGAGAGGGDPGGRAPPASTRARWRDALRHAGVRVHVDDRNEKLGYKIREAQVQKVPYMLVVGDKEVEAQNRRPCATGRRGTSGRRTSQALGARRSRSSPPSARSREEAPPAEPLEVSHRPEDGPHQRPHPRQGSPRHRRGRRPARHHAARAGADASPRRRASTSWRSRPRPPRRSAGS